VRKHQEEELRRLEQALLEDPQEAESPMEEDPLEWVEEFYEDVTEETGYTPPQGFTVRNTDDVDVDLDAYSEEVYRGKRGGCLIPGLITVLALSLLTAMVLWLLQYLGVM
jgi:hypothetical protein